MLLLENAKVLDRMGLEEVEWVVASSISEELCDSFLIL